MTACLLEMSKIGAWEGAEWCQFAIHTLDGHIVWSQYQKRSFENFDF